MFLRAVVADGKLSLRNMFSTLLVWGVVPKTKGPENFNFELNSGF